MIRLFIISLIASSLFPQVLPNGVQSGALVEGIAEYDFPNVTKKRN